MESGKKPSIFSDRGFIGSAGELDEYGVWVKSEPEDIAFDDSAFFDEIGKEAEITSGGGGFGFNAAALSNTDEYADEPDSNNSSGGMGFATDTFDVDFGPEEQSIEEDGASGGAGFETDTFDVDFGADVPKEQNANIGDGGVFVDTSSGVEFSSDTFDVDFGEDIPEEQDAEARDASIEEDFTTNPFNADFGTDETDGGNTDAEARDVSIEEDFTTDPFNADFGTDETDSQKVYTEGADVPVVEKVVAADNLGLDFGTGEIDGQKVYTEGADIPVVGKIVAADNLDLDFGTDEPEEHGLDVEERDVSIGEEFDVDDEEGGGGYDLEIAVDDVLDKPQKAQPADVDGNEKAAPPQAETRSTELLLKIVDELSTIKAELNNLKEEISTMRGEVSTTDIQGGGKNDSGGENESLFGSEAETPGYIDGERLSGRDAASSTQGLEPPRKAAAPDLSVDLDFSAEEEISAASPFGTNGDVSETAEEHITVPPLPEDEASWTDTQSAAYDEAAEDVNTADELELPPPADELELPPPADELELPPPPDELELPPPADELELPPPADDLELPPPADELELPPPADELELELPPPPPKRAAPPPKPKPVVKPAAPQSKATKASPAPAISPPAPQAEAKKAQEKPGQDSSDSQQLKKELQVVLSYMDRLLESLPDDKIEEFARSKQFDIYKKVFKELGLV
ncbi:MAG: hypothetical protein LBJ35_06690 [Spirochaetaceae bacterium]|jgi:hypothetical protein|nr:hypothetical protein [Spirochaetaceae bacterium]